MKNKILLWSIITICASLPVTASCPLTGVCAAEEYTGAAMPSIEDEYIQNNLQNLENQQNPIMKNNVTKPQESYGIQTPGQNEQMLPSEKPYNTNCQFGTCLP